MKKVRKKKSNFGLKTKSLLLSIISTLSIILIFLFLNGPRLYEFLIIPIVLIFYLFGLIIIRERGFRAGMRLELFLTLVIAFFAIMQVWVAMYENLPRVFTPGVKCEDYLRLTNEGDGRFLVSFGNYGKFPAWVYIEFENTTKSISILNKDKYRHLVLVPVNFQDNKQTEITFPFIINTSYQEVSFKLKYLVYGDDLIDRAAGELKILSELRNELTCNYIKINATMYALE